MDWQSRLSRHGLAVTVGQSRVGMHGLAGTGRAVTGRQARMGRLGLGQSRVGRHGLAGTGEAITGRQARVGQSRVGRHGLACFIAFLILLKLHLPCRFIGLYFMFFSFVIPYSACMDQLSRKTPNLNAVFNSVQ
jgi:hypothetical protein